MKRSPLQILGSLVVLGIFCLAVWLLYGQLQHYDRQKVLDSLRQIPLHSIVAAILLTVLNYGILIFYDVLAVRYVGEKLAFAKIALASFCGYACSYNFGATLAGASIRYRLYTAWGVPILKVLQLLVILGLTFWFGVFALAGLVFLVAPLQIPDDQLAQISASIPENLVRSFQLLFANSRPFGTVLLAIAALYVGMAAAHRGTLKIFRWEIPVPPLKLSLYQIGIASADMLVAAWVLYELFPPVHGGYLTVLEVYLVAYVLVVLSHVPGGWGVLEVVMLTMFKTLDLVPNPGENLPWVIAGMVVFRVIYFLTPLLIAAVLLGANELALRRACWHLAAQVPRPASPDGRAEPTSVENAAGEPAHKSNGQAMPPHAAEPATKDAKL